MTTNVTYFFIFCHVLCRFDPLIAGNSETATLLNFSLISTTDLQLSSSVLELGSDLCAEITTSSFVVVVLSLVCARCPHFNCIRKLFLAEVKRLSLKSSQSLVQFKYGSAVGKSIADRWYWWDFFSVAIVGRPTALPFVRWSCVDRVSNEINSD